MGRRTGRRIGRVGGALAVVLLGLCLGPGATRFASGPILQRVGPRSAAVVLHTRLPRRASLAYRRAGSTAPPRTLRHRAARLHVFELTDLEPDRAWSYRVWIDGGAGGPRRAAGAGSFRTAPLPGTGRVRFAAFGDSGKQPWWTKVADRCGFGIATWVTTIAPGRGHQWDIARAVGDQHPDLVLHLGDLVYPDGARKHYREAFFLPFARLLAHVPLYPTLGNHDLLTGGGAPYFETFVLPDEDGPARGRYYTFVHGPVRFLCLDTFSTPLTPGSRQLRWVDETLAASTARWHVVFTHRPFWTESRSKGDTANAALRAYVHPILARHHVTLVLSGHDHVYQRFTERSGVCYVVAGGGGKSLYALGEAPDLVGARRYSFVVVDADARSVRVRAVAQNGEVFDEWSTR